MNRTGKFCKNIFSALFASVSHNKKSTSGNVKLAGWNWRPRIRKIHVVFKNHKPVKSAPHFCYKSAQLFSKEKSNTAIIKLIYEFLKISFTLQLNRP